MDAQKAKNIGYRDALAGDVSCALCRRVIPGGHVNRETYRCNDPRVRTNPIRVGAHKTCQFAAAKVYKTPAEKHPEGYRRAAKGDVPCSECALSAVDRAAVKGAMRYECGWTKRRVAADHTCNKAC